MSGTDNTMTYNGYSAVIRFSSEDDCLVGRIIGINDIVGFHGDSVEEVRKAFHEAVDDYLATCAKVGREPNKPYSGRLIVRTSPVLHQRFALKASREGMTLSQWAAKVLNDAVTPH